MVFTIDDSGQPCVGDDSMLGGSGFVVPGFTCNFKGLVPSIRMFISRSSRLELGDSLSLDMDDETAISVW